jgi:hypothetical protein
MRGQFVRNKQEEIKVPVELCFYALRNKLLPSLKVFILLKMTSSGKCRLNSAQMKLFAEFCGYKSKRAFSNQLKVLLRLNWIGYNKFSGVYHVRSFGNVQSQYGLKSTTGVWIRIQDMQCFDAAIYGSVIGYLSKHQGKEQRIEPQYGGSRQIPCKSPGFYPVANWALAKILRVSTSTASQMKSRAEEEGCVTIKRKRIIKPATHDVFKRLTADYPEQYLNPMIWKGRFYQRFPDLIKSEMKFGMRKKNDK